MINLDQVRTLDWKVKQAVQLIVHLRRENDTLRGRVSEAEVRVQELESLVETLRASQIEVESGIQSVLAELDHLDGEAPADVFTAATPVAAASAPAGAVIVAAADFEPEEPAPEKGAVAVASSMTEAADEGLSQADLGPAPDSVELDESLQSNEAEAFFEDSEPQPASPEDRAPEQPGLGIF